jgi:hypothetical protein
VGVREKPLAGAAAPAATAGPARPARDRVAIGAAVVLAAAAAAAQAWMLRGLRQVPSPLFGGDYAYQAGCIRSILASGDPMASCSCSGALPGYLPFYGTLAALLVRLTGLPVMDAMFLLSVLAHAASALAVAWVVGRHVGTRAGVVMACLWAVVYEPAVLRYTEFTAQVVIPFFFDALLRFVREPRPDTSPSRVRPAVYLGLVLGVLGYAHAVAFVAAIVVTGLSALAVLARRVRREGVAAATRRTALVLGIAGAGAALALGYWYRPLFVHHGQTSLHYREWNAGPGLATWTDQLAYAGGVLARLVKLEPAAAVPVHALFVAGVALLLSGTVRRRFAPVALAFAATLAWLFHFFLTMPLLGTHFVPEYVRSMLWAFVLVLVGGIPVTLLLERMGRRTGSFVVVAAVVAACGGLVLGARSLVREPLMVSAREPYPPHYEALARWASAHTRADDVVLSTNELSFAWSSLTGRKTLVTRRAQNDGFLDMEERNLDAALILYGQDDSIRRARLARWGIDWVLWTEDWIPSEYRIERSGVYGVDPLCWFTDAERDSAAARAGVAILHVKTWVDPAMQSEDIPRFALTAVAPYNYTRPDRPWHADMDTLLERAWSFERDGRRIAAVYRVRRPVDAALGRQ